MKSLIKLTLATALAVGTGYGALAQEFTKGATEAPRHRRLPAGIRGQPFWGASRLRVFIDFDYPATFAGKLARSAIWPDLRLSARQPDCQFPALPRYNVEQSSSASPTG